MNQGQFNYQGQELDLFRSAVNWKTYWTSQVAPYVGSNVLEVGAGLGDNIGYLLGPSVRRWLCLEPDENLATVIRNEIAKGELPAQCSVQSVLLSELSGQEAFDTVIYADVLEHIEADREELEEAMQRIERGGRLIVLSPAHQWLFSPFDASIGHFRRYSAETLGALSPPDSRLEVMHYLDSVGLLASAGNRLLLRSAMPSVKQIELWDRRMVPLSRWLDPIGRFRFGKSILAIWKRT